MNFLIRNLISYYNAQITYLEQFLTDDKGHIYDLYVDGGKNGAK